MVEKLLYFPRKPFNYIQTHVFMTSKQETNATENTFMAKKNKICIFLKGFRFALHIFSFHIFYVKTFLSEIKRKFWCFHLI